MKRVFILSIAILCTACGGGSNSKATQSTEDTDSTLHRITIAPPDMDTLQDLFLSDIADSVYYVSLSKQPILNGADIRVATTDSVMVIGPASATYGDERLRLYDLKGNYKHNLGGGGRGRGEYVHPHWGVNSNNNRAYVHTHMHQKSIMTYTLSKTNKMRGYLSKAKNDSIFHGNIGFTIYPAGDNLVITKSVIYGDNPELILYNPRTNTIIDSLPNYFIPRLEVMNKKYNNQYQPIGIMNNYKIKTEYKDELYYMNEYSDTLYKVSEKEIVPFITFDLGEFQPSFEAIFAPAKNPNLALLRKTLFNRMTITGAVRTSNEFYIILTCKGKRFIYALNLTDYTGRYCKPYFINDLDNGPDYFMSGNSSKPIQIIDVATIKALDEKKKETSSSDRLFPENKMDKKMKNTDEFQKLWDNSTDTSNPIIQFINIKE